MPATELFEGLMNVGAILEVVQTCVQPAFESGQPAVSSTREYVVVREHLAKVFDRGGGRERVECRVVEFESAVADLFEKRAGGRQPYPGDNAARALCGGQFADDPV